MFLSTNDVLGGAATVTFRLVEALRRQGVDARMLVARKDTDRPWIDTVGRARFKMAKCAERAGIFMANGFDRRELWKVSDAACGCGATKHPWVREATTIVLGWINQGLLSLSDIERLERTDKRIVWWMHDLWCATGICHIPPGDCHRYTEGCGRCPLLHGRAGRHDLSERTFRRKAELLGSFRISYLAVSAWQRDVCLSSPILAKKQIKVLGHPLQIERFPVSPSVAGLGKLKNLSPELAEAIKTGVPIVVMGAARLDDTVKGLPIAIEALNIVGRRVLPVFFGRLRDPRAFASLGIPYIHISHVEQELLPELYAAATVVLSTSHFETMGATLMEGIAAGATAVSFGTGGQRDIVVDGECGYIAPYPAGATAGELAANVAGAIRKAISSPFPRMNQHRSIATRFAADAVARRFIEITHAR